MATSRFSVYSVPNRSPDIPKSYGERHPGQWRKLLLPTSLPSHLPDTPEASQEPTLLVAHITWVLWGSGKLQRTQCGNGGNTDPQKLIHVWMNLVLVLCEALVSSLESPIPTHPLEPGSANYSLQAKPGPRPIFVNKALLEHSHAFSCLWPLSCYMAKLSERP